MPVAEMDCLTALATLFFLGLPRVLVSAQSGGFFMVPGAEIVRFQATVVVPPLPSDGDGGAVGIWPGVEDSNGFVYQTVISDSKTPGAWEFWVEYCCQTNYEAPPVKVYPGDMITSTFSRNPNGWTNAWSVSPGPTGKAAGQNFQTGLSSNAFTGTISKAVLAVELQGGASWDFGQIQWSSVTVTALTTRNWCSTGYSNTVGFPVSTPNTRSSTLGPATTCSYGHISFG